MLVCKSRRCATRSRWYYAKWMSPAHVHCLSSTVYRAAAALVVTEGLTEEDSFKNTSETMEININKMGGAQETNQH